MLLGFFCLFLCPALINIYPIAMTHFPHHLVQLGPTSYTGHSQGPGTILGFGDIIMHETMSS